MLQKKENRLKRRHILSSAREKEKESSLDQRVKNHGNGWLTSTKRQVSTEESNARRKQITYKICRLFYRQTRHFANVFV